MILTGFISIGITIPMFLGRKKDWLTIQWRILNDANELVLALAWRNCPSILIYDIGWKLKHTSCFFDNLRFPRGDFIKILVEI